MQTDKEMIDIFLEDIIPNRFQPRLSFDEKTLHELADSIKQHGVIQPIVVRKVSDKYEIIAGERRYKAAMLAGLTKIPAILIAVDDNISAEMAVAENTQREDLNAIERASSFKKLLDRGYLTQEQLAVKLGVTQATISNTLRLLTLTPEIQEALLNRKISERHARSLLMLKNPIDQNDVLNRITSQKLTVKQTDDLIKGMIGVIASDINLPKEDGILLEEIPQTQSAISEATTNPSFQPSVNKNLVPSFLNDVGNASGLREDNEGVVTMLEENNQKTANVEQMKEQSFDINPVKNELDFNQLLNTNSNQAISDISSLNTNNDSQLISNEIPSSKFIPAFDDEETNMETQEPFTYSKPSDFDNKLPINDSTINDTIQNSINPTPSPIKDTNLDFLLNEYNQQQTFISPETPDVGNVALDLKGAINRIRETVKNLEKNGLIVDTEEFDFENLYQIIIKINK